MDSRWDGSDMWRKAMRCWNKHGFGIRRLRPNKRPKPELNVAACEKHWFPHREQETSRETKVTLHLQ